MLERILFYIAKQAKMATSHKRYHKKQQFIEPATTVTDTVHHKETTIQMDRTLEIK